MINWYPITVDGEKRLFPVNMDKRALADADRDDRTLGVSLETQEAWEAAEPDRMTRQQLRRRIRPWKSEERRAHYDSIRNMAAEEVTVIDEQGTPVDSSIMNMGEEDGTNQEA